MGRPQALAVCLPLPTEGLRCWRTAGIGGLTQPWQHPWGWGLSQHQFLLGPASALVISGMQVTAAVFYSARSSLGSLCSWLTLAFSLPSSLWCLYKGEPCFLCAFSLHFPTHLAGCFSTCQALGVTWWCLPSPALHCPPSCHMCCSCPESWEAALMLLVVQDDGILCAHLEQTKSPLKWALPGLLWASACCCLCGCGF